MLDVDGEVVAENSLDIEETDGLTEAYEGSKAALEATGNYYQIYDVLDEYLDVMGRVPARPGLSEPPR